MLPCPLEATTDNGQWTTAMAAPATIDAFLELVRKSGMIDGQQLDAYCGRLRTEATPSPARSQTPFGNAGGVTALARKMVQDGLLTNFQAEQYLKGKWHGFTIGNYRIIERIARGGMGTVYLGEHLSMPRRVAVKVLPGELAKNPMIVERFYREARAAAALDHPNLVKATDVDCDHGVHFLVMEFIDGVNLQDLVDRKGPLRPERAANYIAQAACGMQHASAVAGMVHRDIKPANLILDRGGVVKLLDMGLARMRQAGFFNAQSDDITKNYNDQNILGTADYIAPEQALDSQGADIRADLYSLGGTFQFLLTGQPPFPGGSLTQKLMWHQIKPVTPVRSLRPDVPEAIEALIIRMMAKAAADRSQTPAEVIAALALWLASPAPPTADEVPPLCAAARQGDSSPIRNPKSEIRKESFDAVNGGADTSASGLPRADTEQSLPGQKQPAATPKSEIRNPKPEIRNPTKTTSSVSGFGFRVSGFGFCKGWVAAAALLALAAGVVFWLRSRPAPAKEDNKPGPGGARKPDGVFVERSGDRGEQAFATVAEALVAARPGDRVVVCADEWKEQLTVNGDGRAGQDVMLEGQAPSGKLVRWLLPANATRGKPLLSLRDVAGLRVRGFQLDGANRVANLVVLAGKCPGLSLERMHCRGFRDAAVIFAGCQGTEAEPVLLRELRTTTDPASVPLGTSGTSESALRFGVVGCAHIRVCDCRLEGPCRAGVEVVGDMADVDFQRNRFFQMSDGLLYHRSEPRHRLEVSLVGNVFCDVRHVLHFVSLPAPARTRLVVRNNVFSKVAGSLSQADDHPVEPAATALVSQPCVNVTNHVLTQGFPFLETRFLPFTLADNPADDASFLRPPDGIR